MKRIQVKHRQIVKEWKAATPREIAQAITDNFLYGFLGAMIMVTISLKIDVAVLFSQVIYYLYVGKIINRPKYVTQLGKIVIFPTSSALGAFTGYKISVFLLELIKNQ
jgi:hypothetical protein